MQQTRPFDEIPEDESSSGVATTTVGTIFGLRKQPILVLVGKTNIKSEKWKSLPSFYPSC